METTTHSDENQELGYESLLQQVLESAPHVGKALTRAHRNRVRELNRYLNADAIRRRFPGTYFAGLEEIFSALDTTTDAYQRSSVLKDVAFLIARVRSDFESAIDAALAGFNGVVVDTMRDVMEVEYLLRDFLYDRQRITAWVGADRAMLLNEFSPVALRRRHAARVGTVPEKLSDAFEYRLHSEGLHVSPSFMLDDLAGKGFTDAPSPRATEFCFAEMFEHARRMILAAHDLGVSIEGPNWPGPDARAGMPEAAKAWGRTRAVMEVISRFERATRESTSS